ncbi:LytTR family DNA-binding domain-containing protein [Clostridium sp. D46t1_190503_E9]|uniref:LytR/AlgR family response regulator transcription factor n=1 Tax=Clostridium sp. D46t1_190503_E9 TaxID=2787137 RepID=UPI00189978E8|nr:LytTR family DNA-binding domain-containing protein [Clostridium sp. D46t1_190503_E9]
MNILLVEDDIIQSSLLREMIEIKYIDVRVYEAKSEKESMSIIEKVDIDVFFLDIKLKESSGLKLAENIRKIEKYELSPIVFVSGQIGYMIDALKKVNCYDFITKPFEMEDITKIIDKFLRHKNKIINENYSYFKTVDGNEIKINKSDIIFIEYYLKKCIIHTTFGEHNIKSNGLEKLINEINYKNIIRTHKSFAVNIDYLKEIRKVNTKLWEITFYNYDKVSELSYNYRNDLKK